MENFEFISMYTPELSCGGMSGKREYEFTVLIHIDGEDNEMRLHFFLN
jgi:hypothetical protein